MIVSVAAVQQVIARRARGEKDGIAEQIDSGKIVTQKVIVPRSAGQRVVAAPAEEAIVSLAAIQLVAARSVGGREHLDPKKVRTVQVITRQQIIAGIARQHIIAAAAE